jgi:hypothetical protein
MVGRTSFSEDIVMVSCSPSESGSSTVDLDAVSPTTSMAKGGFVSVLRILGLRWALVTLNSGSLSPVRNSHHGIPVIQSILHDKKVVRLV